MQKAARNSDAPTQSLCYLPTRHSLRDTVQRACNGQYLGAAAVNAAERRFGPQ
jgi:hypothetical protein